MIETVPQIKKTFSEEIEEYINQLQNDVSELDASLPNFAQQLDCLISNNKLLRYSAINANADFYIPKSPFAQITDHFEKSINLLRDRHAEVDWITKGILLEAINMMSQIINEYCLETEGSSDWLELQNNLFEQLNEHLMLNTDKSEVFQTEDNTNNEPFNLEDSSEALHLFDANMEIDSEEQLSSTKIGEFNNFDGFLMIQLDDKLDEEEAFNDDELSEELDNKLDEEEASNKVELPMPEVLADIFSVSFAKQLLDSNNRTELQTELQEVNETERENPATFEGDFEDTWTRFSSPESWSILDDSEVATLEELEASFNLSNDDDVFANDFFETSLGNNNMFKNSLKSKEDLQLDEFFVEQPLSSNQLNLDNELDNELRRLEMFKAQNFDLSDVDTAIEESPIYQNSVKDINLSSHNLTLINSNHKETSYKDKNPETTLLSPISSFNDSTIRLPLNHLEALGDLSEELLVRKGILDIYLGEMKILVEEAQTNLQVVDLQELEASSVNQKQNAIANLNNALERLVHMIDCSEQQTYVLAEDARHLRQNLRQALKCPVSNLVRRFPRILHDLSLQQGKQVELIVEGAEVGIERVISEMIAEPLELLLRNAFEYGIESPEERQQQGKELQGKIEVIATQTNESTVIKISDDGRGIENGNKLGDLREKLAEIGGLITIQSQLGRGTEFTMVLPNTLSLMRVLLINIDQICLAIPSKIIQEVVPIEAHNNWSNQYLSNENSGTILWRDRVIPVIQLHPLLKLNCRHNSNQDPLPTSSRPFSNQPEKYQPANAVPSFIVIAHENELFALQTDGCWNDQEATFHQIEGDILLPQIFLGTVILGSDQAIALINPSELVNQCLRSPSPNTLQISQPPHQDLDSSNLNNLSSLSDFFEGSGDSLQDASLSTLTLPSVQVLEQSPKPENLESSGLFMSALANDQIDSQTKRSHQPKVLIVESSANIRRYLAMTLAKSGFLTEQVQNGKEAIEFLKERLKVGLDIDIVITDLKTPQMDGFKLLSGIRTDESLHSLPVVVLTSRNNDNDQKLALELGANAYFSKPYREEELVTTLQQIISG